MKPSSAPSNTHRFVRFAAFAGCVAASVFSPASAATEPVAANPQTGERYAVVLRIKGDVRAGPASEQTSRRLSEGAVVFVGERLRAAENGEAVLNADDASMIAVRPGAEFVMERFAAAGTADDRWALRLFKGSLRVITGWIARLNRANYRVSTPAATIGVRGTDHEPYVLTARMAETTTYQEGTYDKVNRGTTVIEAGGRALDIDAGKVGFVRGQREGVTTRGLMTILLPVLLEKVPDFYVPGQFDAELDQYSQTADAAAARRLEEKRAKSRAKPAASCNPTAVAKNWLKRFDGAIVRRDAAAIIELFSPAVKVKATVRNQDGSMTTIELERDELARSTIEAVKGLENYRHRRISIEANVAEPAPSAACDRISVRSLVLERGLQHGKPFRFESLEEFQLALTDGRWLAIEAQTTQR